MLSQQTFEQQHQADWQSLDNCLRNLETLRWWKRTRVDVSVIPTLYAALCQQHAIAHSRGYSHTLTEQLHRLIIRAHHQLYRQRSHWLPRLWRFVGGGFARALRAEKKLFSLACFLFLLPALSAGVMSAVWPATADMFLGSNQRIGLERMYQPDGEPLRPDGLESASNFLMFGFYIMNNIGIDFRVFAGGILLGVGSLFFLLFNGVHIGAAAGYLTGKGYIAPFWGFVAGHSALLLQLLD